MRVDMPAAAVEEVLKEQHAWEKQRQTRAEENYHYKRYSYAWYKNLDPHMHVTYYRNKQKTAQNMRHEAEKLYMLQWQDAGIAVGEYQGRGQGENVAPDPEVEPVSMDFDSNEEDDFDDSEIPLPSDELPLLFFFDVETTGLVVYNDVIIDIAAKVVDIPPSVVSQPTYQSLVRTSKSIPDKGRNYATIMNQWMTKKYMHDKTNRNKEYRPARATPTLCGAGGIFHLDWNHHPGVCWEYRQETRYFYIVF